MKKLLLLAGVILSITFGATAQTNPPPVPGCILDVTLSSTAGTTLTISSTLYLDFHDNMWEGMALLGDWSNRNNGCSGPEITITANPGSEFECSPWPRQVGAVTWFCDGSCDPNQELHVMPIIFPANCTVWKFHLTKTATAMCGISLTCQSTVTCIPVEPPPNLWH